MAQCLEIDVAVQARRRDELLYQLHKALAGQLLLDMETGVEPLRHLPRAPQRFWRMWEAGTPVATGPSVSFEGKAGRVWPRVEVRRAKPSGDSLVAT